VNTNTVRLHRVIAAKPAKVYKAFIDPDAMARWLPPDGFTAKVYESEPRVGGRYRMSFTNFTTGNMHAFGGEYLELVPDRKLRYTDKFEDPALSAADIEVTVELKAVPAGTELHIVQSGLPEMIPLDGCYLGWQQSLNNLARLVEPEINE